MIIEMQFFAKERVICCFNICVNKIKGVNVQPQANPGGGRAASLWKWRFQTLIFEDTNFANSNPTKD